MTNDNDYEMNKDKLEFFMDQKIKVHISLRDGSFLNGLLIKKVREGVYWLEERILGEVFVFLKDIVKIDKFYEKKEVKKEENGRRRE